MKDQIEEIQKEHLEAIMDNHYLGAFDRNAAAESCALITKKRMDIARLEGMIKAYEEWHISELLRPSKKQIHELREQLEELKKD